MTTDSTAARLLQAILDDPDDDAVRLIYADWLEEIGQEERAEFIRVQIELRKHEQQAAWLENMPAAAWTGSEEEGRLLRRLEPLLKRHRELCKKHVTDCQTWSREFVKGVLGSNWLSLSAAWQWGWSNGFIEQIECPTADWVAHADQITAAHPIRAVRMTDNAIGWVTNRGQDEAGDFWEYFRKGHPFGLLYVRFAGQEYCAEDLGISDRPDVTSYQQDRDILFRHRWPRITFTFPE